MIERVDDLRLFVLIASAGSLSEAARRGSLSLASVSRRLAALEDDVGVRLIDRGSRRFALTDEGKLLLKRAEIILNEVDATSAELDARAGIMQGRIRISAPIEIGRHQIARLVREFTAMHPRIQIELTLTDDRPDILTEELDLALQTKRPTASDVIHRKLLSSERVMCAAPSYVAAHGSPASPDDLVNHRCIVLRRGVRLYDVWTMHCAGEKREIGVTGHLISNGTDTVHLWAREGGGIAVKARWDIEEDLRAGDLVTILPDCRCDDIHLYAVYNDRRHVPHRTRTFIDFLVDRLPNFLTATG